MDSYLSQLHTFQMMRRKESEEKALVSFFRIVSKAESFLRIPETLICGFGLREPTLFYSTASGIKGVAATAQNLSDFVGICTHHSNAASIRPPLCLVKQDTKNFISDSLAISQTWHKAVAGRKDIILQRFIVSAGNYQRVVFVTWKPSGTIMLTSVSKVPLQASRQKDLSLANPPTTEDTFLPCREKAIPETQIPEALSSLVSLVADCFARHFEGEHYSELEEMVLECIQDRSQQWVVIKVKSFELGRKMKALGQLKMQTEVFGKINTNLKANERKNILARPKSVKFGLSPAIVDVKRLIGLPVSPYEVQQALRNLKHSRDRGIQTAPHKAKRAHHRILAKSLQEPEDLGNDDLTFEKRPEDMPPIFQFPTPKTPSDLQPGLETMPKDQRIGAIREHIVRQNNSLFMRIHFQEELPEKRLLQDLCSHSIDKAVTNLDTLRARAAQEKSRRRVYVK